MEGKYDSHIELLDEIHVMNWVTFGTQLIVFTSLLIYKLIYSRKLWIIVVIICFIMTAFSGMIYHVLPDTDTIGSQIA